MKDIVRIFEDICLAKGWDYTYGKTENLNLKIDQSNEFDINGNPIDTGKIYMLAEPATRRYVTSNSANSSLVSTVFTGVFMVVQKSNLAMQYFGEMNQNTIESKYAKHVEPLLNELPSMLKSITCADFKVTNWEVVDWIDYLDQNRDGIMVRYTLQYDF